MSFAKYLVKERKKRNVSSEELAIACGVSRSYITLIENDSRLPSKKILPKIARALYIEHAIVIGWYLDTIREKLQ